MKRKKLLRKIKAFLSSDRRAQVAKVDSLEKILKKLEKKKVALRDKLDGEKEEAQRRELLRKLEVVDAQHKKGAKLAKKLKALRDAG